tara:strand:+ start:96 stop:1262 length:1167 start_codon:yes stop_codon:yes gene_type:complete
MSKFNKIIALSKQIANSLMKNEDPIALDQSKLFSEEDKKYILKNLTDKSNLKEYKDLKNSINIQKDWLKVKPKKKTRKLYYKLAAAASIALIISLTIFFNKSDDTNEFTEPIIVNNQIKAGTDKATLTLESGEEIALQKGQPVKTKNATGSGEEITYQTTKNQKPKTNTQIAYNILTIPRGGQFKTTLADGTIVWLNSESQIKYPVAFAEGKTRQVELVYGEAYFDVSPSTDHKGADFKVYHKAQEVKVLGTEFNVKAYKDEVQIFTTLVEGKVAIHTDIFNKTLEPGEQSVLNIVPNNISIKKVDIRPEIAWRDGVFIFKKKNLKDIMTTLSRWYDMDVVFLNKNLETIQFNGALNKNQSIVDLLNDIKNFGIIKNYEINNNKVTLK